MISLYHGDCLEVMRGIPDGSVDSVVVDPPYGISFMSKKWDYDVPRVVVWREVLRVLKPGGHMLCACGTRTQHRMVVNIEDAGFEIRDVVSWVFGSGFPKSMSISKAIDKAAGAERDIIGRNPNHRSVSGVGYEGIYSGGNTGSRNITASATDAAKQWDGWGTALKPACEFFTLARKPLREKTIAANVQKWGTGAINIDGCRVETIESLSCGAYSGSMREKEDTAWQNADRKSGKGSGFRAGIGEYQQPLGRFPANMIHDGSEEVLGLFPETKSGGGDKASKKESPNRSMSGKNYVRQRGKVSTPNSGSAARFFYCAKTSKSDRNEGLSDGAKNDHPTVKPTALMEYLCRLITPPGGTVFDPFMGSGSTGKAATEEGFGFIGIEIDKGYFEIAKQRIESVGNSDVVVGKAKVRLTGASLGAFKRVMKNKLGDEG